MVFYSNFVPWVAGLSPSMPIQKMDTHICRHMFPVFFVPWGYQENKHRITAPKFAFWFLSSAELARVVPFQEPLRCSIPQAVARPLWKLVAGGETADHWKGSAGCDHHRADSVSGETRLRQSGFWDLFWHIKTSKGKNPNTFKAFLHSYLQVLSPHPFGSGRNTGMLLVWFILSILFCFLQMSFEKNTVWKQENAASIYILLLLYYLYLKFGLVIQSESRMVSGFGRACWWRQWHSCKIKRLEQSGQGALQGAYHLL